ncbi:hypothetical protein ANO11243_034410 [Dothideomycetidae sp. 11243]|nr:hypothetical protein ANO11243_034410 [fungal sp. No.11243]
MHHFPTYFSAVVTAHASLALLTFLVLFPSGVFIRILDVPNSRKIHGYVQTFAYCTLMAVIGMGIWMAKTIHVSLNHYHPTIGLIVFSLVSLQYFGGFARYLFWKRDKRHPTIAAIHENGGRIVVALGLINGGLGLHFAHKVHLGVYITYGIAAVLVCSAYVAVTIFKARRRRQVRESRVTFGK